MEQEIKNPGKVAGGLARAKKLGSGKRKEIARTAAITRWSGPAQIATHAGEIHIGDITLDCAVLEDGRRVLSQRGVNRALGRKHGGEDFKRRNAPGGELPVFLGPANLRPYVSSELEVVVSKPIMYKQGGTVAHGVDASVLPQICDVWLKARDAGALKVAQLPAATQADILMRGLAHVGIIALVDEATGYQRDRATDALAKILQAFIAKELQPYIPTFKPDYYAQLFRLRGLEYPQDRVQRPQYFGVLTNDIVYKRLAPGVLEELKKVIPRNESGRPTAKYFQKLTQNKGYPKLMEHLGAVMAIMKLSTDYHDFIDKLDRLHPRYDQQMLLPYEPGTDSGKGI
jgi:hypothetical protein